MALNTPVPVGEDPVKRARSRASRIRDGIHNYLATLGDIARAWEDGDWQHLKYESWDAYVDGEFGEERLRLPKEYRQKAVQELRLAGMSQRAIAKAVNEPRHVVRGDLEGGRPRPTNVDQHESPELPQVTTAEVAANTSSEPAESVGGAVEAASGAAHLESSENKPPLVEAIKQRLTDVQAKVDADKALLDSIEDNEMRDHDYVTRFVHAVAKVLKVAEFDADRIADLADEDQLLQLSTSLDSLTRFTEKVRRRRSGLRLIAGGAS